MTEKIPSDAIVLAAAYGSHINALGKYWGLAGTITILAFTADTSSGVVELFGLKLRSAYFYPACAIFGAILNFAYCISHLQAYRAGEIFRDYLSSIDAGVQQFTSNNTVLDVAHLLYPSAINRVYPVLHFLPFTANERIVQFLKLPVDLFVFTLPISGSVYAASRLDRDVVGVSIWSLVLVSALLSVVLAWTGMRWLFKRKSNLKAQIPAVSTES